MCTIGTPAERARSSRISTSSSAACTPSSSITPRVYVFWQSIRTSVDSAKLTGCWGRSARARSVVGSGTLPTLLGRAAGDCEHRVRELGATHDEIGQQWIG